MRRRTLSARSAVAIDVALALAAGVTGVWREVAYPPQGLRLLTLPTWVYVVVQVVGALTLLLRRSRPIEVGLANAALSLLSPTQAAYVAAYALGAYVKNKLRAAAAFGALVVGWILGAQIWQLRDKLGGPLLLALGMLAGLYVASRRSLYDLLADRAEQAERDQELLARLAVADEQERLAREMHDVVTHRVSLMVLQAGALRISTDDESTRQSAESIRQAGVQALSELRELIGTVRDEPARSDAETLTSAPSIAGVVDAARATGVIVDVDQQGRDEQMTPTVARTVLRIVQEGLTNAAKHSPGALVTVRLRHSLNGSRVHVLSAPTAGAADRDLQESGSGTGLTGLRHRVEIVGGSFAAGRTDDGGFEIVARVPARVSGLDDA